MNNTLVQRCGKCGQEWVQAHFCPALDKPGNDGAKEVRPLTEQDIRRIVRDEMQRTGMFNSPNA